MSGLFDRLLDQPDDEDDSKPAGLTPLDIADLPPLQRRIMFTLLRDKEAASGGITQEDLAEKLGHPDDLASTLEELASNDWLLTLDEAPHTRYKVNLRRKRPRSQGSNLWSSITSRLTEDSGSAPDSAQSDSSDAGGGSPPGSPQSDSHDPENRPRRPPFPDISKW